MYAAEGTGFRMPHARHSLCGGSQRAGVSHEGLRHHTVRKPEFSCAFARRRLFFIKNPAHLELYVEGLFKAGITT
jgi:hypothetical protein